MSSFCQISGRELGQQEDIPGTTPRSVCATVCSILFCSAALDLIAAKDDAELASCGEITSMGDLT